ncbi:CaiB/BaiF CoA transferase family protein [Chloroflexota bacterium]
MKENTRDEGNPETPSSDPNRKALGGIRVVEWSQFVTGPYCAKLLADLGAEVIKVEKPGLGDEARHRAPFVHDNPHPEHSLLFLYLNTNKLGINLDPKSPSEREKFIELIKWADILIEDNPLPILQELRLTYDDLRKLNPGLVMTSITPFGQTGPYSSYKAYPINTYHSGGLGDLGPHVAGVQSQLKPGGFFGECACGLVGAVGTIAALYYQQVTGLGQQVDISKQEAILSLARVQVDRYPNEGIIQSRLDGPRSTAGIFQCKDGYIAETASQPHQWRALIELISNSQMEKYEKYLDDNFREQNWPEITQYVSDWMMNRTMEEIYHQGQALGVTITPVMTTKDIVDSPQSSARQFFIEANHSTIGRLKYPTTPYRFSVTPSTIERSAPLLGQHTQEVFSGRLHSSEQGRRIAESIKQSLGDRSKEGQGPLQGIRIADFSWAWAGSHATELLVFMGAQVIKIESMKRIDATRQQAFTTGQQFSDINESPVFNDINLGKLSIKLNLSQPKAIELAKKLVSISDVTAQNMRPGVMERLGLGYDVLKEVKPDIIYLSSSSRGVTGPERGYAGYAPNFAALGGISHITGTPDSGPAFWAGEIDLISATTSTFAVLAALNYRLKTGEGQHIDLSSSEAISVLIGDVLMDYLVNGRVQTRKGNLDESMAPHNCYRCKGEDKWISIAIAADEEWEALCKVLGNPVWAKEQRFLTASNRWQNQEELDSLIEKWTSDYSPYEVMEMLQKAGIAAMPSFNAEELFNNPHLNYRQCWTKVTHPVLGEQSVLTPPWKLSDTPAKVSSAAPLLGQHSNYVFKELLGLSDDEISLLEEEEIIY